MDIFKVLDLDHLFHGGVLTHHLALAAQAR